MIPFHFAIYMGVICSVILVIGGLLLLLRGAISLESQSSGSNTSSATKVGFHGLSVATDSPTIALFGIGVVFLGVSIWFARPQLPVVVPVQVQATIASDALEGAEPLIYAAVPLSPMLTQGEHSEDRIIYRIDRPLYHRQDPEGESVTLIAFLPGGKYTMREGYVRNSEGNGSLYSRSVIVGDFRLPSSRPAPLPNGTIVPAPPLPGLDDSRLEGGQ